MIIYKKYKFDPFYGNNFDLSKFSNSVQDIWIIIDSSAIMLPILPGSVKWVPSDYSNTNWECSFSAVSSQQNTKLAVFGVGGRTALSLNRLITY